MAPIRTNRLQVPEPNQIKAMEGELSLIRTCLEVRIVEDGFTDCAQAISSALKKAVRLTTLFKSPSPNSSVVVRNRHSGSNPAGVLCALIAEAAILTERDDWEVHHADLLFGLQEAEEAVNTWILRWQKASEYERMGASPHQDAAPKARQSRRNVGPSFLA